MGLSKSKTKTVNTSAPATFASPYINQALSSSQSVFNANQGNLNSLANSAVAGYNSIAPAAYSPNALVTSAQAAAAKIGSGSYTGTNPGAATYQSLMSASNPALSTLGTMAQGSISPGNYAGLGTDNPAYGSLQSIANGTSGTNGAAGYDADVLSGKYLNGNPYIDAIVQQGTDAATKAANQRFGASGLGAGLSSAYDSALGSAVSNASNTVRYQAYDAERARQDAASGRISSNFNADQDRSASAASSLGSLYNAGQGIQLNAQQARDAAFQNDRSSQLAAATGLGSLYNQNQQTQLGAAQAADSNYQQQLAAQLQALGMTGSLTDAQYAGISPALSLLGASAQIPYTGVNAYSGLVNGLTNGYGTQTGTTTQKQGLGQIAAGLGGVALGGWASGGFK